MSCEALVANDDGYFGHIDVVLERFPFSIAEVTLHVEPKQAAAFWSDYYGRLPMWRAVVNRLSWKREVDENGITVPGSMSLSYL